MAARPRELTPDRSARHLFGSEMRRLRETAGMSLERLAAIVRYSKSSLARFETAESMIPPDLPAQLDAAFGTGGLFEKLYPLACKEIHPDKYRRRMELEARARVIEEYAGQVVPGLMQTEDYARALFSVSNPKAGTDVIEEMVAIRLGRQELLRADPPPDLSFILDEAVIRRPVGGPQVMRAQLSFLVDHVDTPSSVIQLLPFEHGEHALMGGSLTLFTLADRSAAAHEESFTVGTLFEDAESVGVRRRAYDLLRAYALSPSKTAALLREAMEALPT